jgi:excisionase family DNA binding protein
MAATLEETDLAPPSREDSELAGEAGQRLARLVRGNKPLRLKPESGPKGETVEVPAAAARLLVRLLQEMAKGNAVTIIPVHAEITTQQAADLLGVSRPFVIKLLEEKRLPFHLVGTHRRIRFQDLASYKRKADAERQKVLAELAREAQELGLGY